MPTIICPSCGKEIRLDPVAYWNTDGVEIKCPQCQALLNIRLKGGELKQVQVIQKQQK